MSEKESWDDELEGMNKGDHDQESPDRSPDSAAAARSHESGDAAENDLSDDKPNSDNELGAAKSEASQDQMSQRARKVQRARRAKINNPNISGELTTTPTSTPNTNQSTKTNAPTPVPKPVSPPKQVQRSQAAASKQDKTAGNSPANKPKEATVPQSTPVQIPPHIMLQNEGGSEFVYEEPSKVLAGLCCMGEGILNGILGAWQLLKALALAVAKVLMYPLLSGTLLYVGALLVAGRFLLDTRDVSHVASFEMAFKYVLSNSPWAAFPVFAGILLIHTDTNKERLALHHQFLYETFIDSSVLILNGMILTTHGEDWVLAWIGAIFIVSALFRMLYWLSLFHLSPRWRQAFRTPSLLNTLVLGVYNWGEAFRATCLSGLFTEGTISNLPVTGTGEGEPVTATGDLPTHAAANQEPGMFINPNVCKIMQRIFCNLDYLQ